MATALDIRSPKAVAVMRERTALWRRTPAAFVADTFTCDPEGQPVKLDKPQLDFLQALADHDRVAWRASHGVGKTATQAIACLWWLATRKPALVVTLAGTWNHLEDKLWPEIHQWGRNWILREAFEWQDLGIYHKQNPDGWRAVASSSDDPKKIEGWHSPNLLVLIDEAKAVPDEVQEAIRGALTQVSATGAKPKFGAGSTPPLHAAGWFPALFKKQASDWKLLHTPAMASARVSQAWIDEMARDFGEDSPVYVSKVLGDIPEHGSITVLPLSYVERAQAKAENEYDRRPPVIVCDVAREGKDLTAIGRIWRGKHRIVTWRGENTIPEVVAMCRNAVLPGLGVPEAAVLCIDDTGIGGGVTDYLKAMQQEQRERERANAQRFVDGDPFDNRMSFPTGCQIVPVKLGGVAEKEERFVNAKSELWWATREAMRHGEIALQSPAELAAMGLPRGSSLVEQLTSAIFEEDDRNRIRVIDKRPSELERRERYRSLPIKSPDLGHTLVMGVKYWRKLRPVVEQPKTLVEQHVARVHSNVRGRIASLVQKQRERQSGGGTVGGGYLG